MPRYPLHHSFFWERAPLIKILLPLIAGIVFYDKGCAPGLSAQLLFWAISCAGIAFAILAFIKRRSATMSIAALLSLQIFFTALSVFLCRKSDVTENPSWFGRDTTDAKGWLVKLTEPMQEKERTWKLRVSVLKSIEDGRSKIVTGDALVSLYKTEDDSLGYAAGDTLLLAGAQWQPVKNAGNPFEYDYAKASHRKGIYYQCFASPDDLAVYGKLCPASLSFIDRLHAWSDAQLSRYLHDTATLGLLQAMILGDEHNFDPTIRQAYSDTGVIHIVSISGSHVAMLFLLITSLLFWLRGRHAGWIKYTIGVIIVWIYILMAGAPPPAVRSGLMFTAVALGVIFSREKQPLNILFAAAIVLLCYEPMWLFSVGFQLSFGAVLSLTLFYAPLNALWPKGRYLEWWATKWMPAGIAASVAAEVLTAPLVVYYFHNLPLFVIIANLLAAVLIGLCALVGGFGILVFSGWPALANVLAFLLVKVVHFFNAAMLLFQRLTFRSWKYLNLTFPELIVLYCAIAAAGYGWLEKSKAAFKIAISAASALIILLCVGRYDALRQERLIVYNVGRVAAIERVTGRSYQPLLAADTERYTTKATHTGWQCWQKSVVDSSSIFYWRGQKILLLRNRPSASMESFKVDVLIIPVSVKGLSVAGLSRIFHPKKIVLCGQQSRWYKALFKDSCAMAGLALHDVSLSGAYILE